MKIVVKTVSKPAERVIVYKRIEWADKSYWSNWKPLISFEQAKRAVEEARV